MVLSVARAPAGHYFLVLVLGLTLLHDLGIQMSHI